MDDELMDDAFGHYPKTAPEVQLIPDSAADFVWILPEEIAAMLDCDIDAIHRMVLGGRMEPPKQIFDTCQMGWMSLMH